ncbi:MAG: hypothetical protein LBU46_04925 [Candidatus Accumulibacter sp.]|jgi:hypothetical protein|nr:hypothetical protein [Accumulibacter sp.]
MIVPPYLCSEDIPATVHTQKPWDYVAEFLERLAQHDQIQVVREFKQKWFRNHVVSKQVDVLFSEKKSIALIARRAVKLGTIFFLIDCPMPTIQVQLAEIGYVSLP